MSQTSLPIITILGPSLYKEAAALCACAYQNDAAVLKILGHLQSAKRLRVLSKYWELLIRFTARHGTAICILEAEKLAGIKLFYTHAQYPPSNITSFIFVGRMAFTLVPVLG